MTVGLESIRNFNVRAKVVGPQGVFVKHIQQETATRVQIKGIGSGFIEQETGRESDEPMHIHITFVFTCLASKVVLNLASSGPDEQQVSRARILTEDLLEVVRSEHAKTYVIVQQQQAELQSLQGGYGAYGGYSVSLLRGFALIVLLTDRSKGYAPPPSGAPPPPPPGDAPPPPPGEAPPPPPGGAPSNGTANGANGPPSASDVDAYAQYWYALFIDDSACAHNDEGRLTATMSLLPNLKSGKPVSRLSTLSTMPSTAHKVQKDKLLLLPLLHPKAPLHRRHLPHKLWVRCGSSRSVYCHQSSLSAGRFRAYAKSYSSIRHTSARWYKLRLKASPAH